MANNKSTQHTTVRQEITTTGKTHDPCIRRCERVRDIQDSLAGVVERVDCAIDARRISPSQSALAKMERDGVNSNAMHVAVRHP